MNNMFTMRSNRFGKTFGQLTGFGIFGLIGFGVNLCATTFLHEVFFVSVKIAYAAGLIAAILTNFYFCRNLVFQSDGNPRHQLIVFVFSSFLFRGLEYGAFLLQEITIGLPYIVAIIIIHATSFFIKFFYYKLLVFTRGR